MGAPTPFKFGYHVTDEKSGAIDRNAPVLYPGERHILLFGVNGAGKSTRILIENLARQLRNRSGAGTSSAKSSSPPSWKPP